MSFPRVSRYDLHAHSTSSDGTLAPAELVRRAAARGVQVFALTDHDTTAGLAEALATAREAAIEFIPAVEISVTWNGHTLHVVGLRVDANDETLLAGLEANRSGRTARAERMAAGLANAGIEGALEGARAYVTNTELVSRTHFARFLVDGGHARSVGAVFERYLSSGKPGYVPHAWASLQSAIGWVACAGGIPVLAHPGRYRLDETQRNALLAEFRDAGGVGVEVVTGSHTPDQYGYWARRAREFGLLASVGSDFHSPGESSRDLGDLPPLPSGCSGIWERL